MTEDIDYCESVSIYTEDGQYAVAATSPCHRPCVDMEGMKDVDPNKTRRSALAVQELREKYGLKKSSEKQRIPNPLSYHCSEAGCTGPLIGEPNENLKDDLDARWLKRLKNNSNQLPKKLVKRRVGDEAA